MPRPSKVRAIFRRTTQQIAHTAVWFGEAAGLVHRIDPAALFIERIVAKALEQIRGAGTQVG